MEKCKNILEMQLENSCTPWQTAEGDHETWIILRKRINLAPLEIKELHGACISSFNWEVVSENAKSGGTCKGNIGLALSYELNNKFSNTSTFQLAGNEENILQDYLTENVRLAPEKNKSAYDEGRSSFASILIKEPEKRNTGCRGERIIDLPWQAGFCFGGKISEPKIILIHMFLEGISTILTEVLLKLNGGLQEIEERSDLKRHLHFPKEEGLTVITGDNMQEVLALVTKRGFKNICCGSAGKSLCAKAVVKYTLVYLSENKGGPRIQMATCFKNEERNFRHAEIPAYQPAGQRYCMLSAALKKIDAQKAAYKNELILEIIDDIPSQPEKALVTSDVKPILNNPAQVIVNPRKRPGEKWLRQDNKQAKRSNRGKTILNIKLI